MITRRKKNDGERGTTGQGSPVPLLPQENIPSLLSSLIPSVHWNHYIPHTPTPRQLAFLALERHKEVFYGGAAGGGKSDALLMAALQFCHIPGYNAIIFRKTLSDHKLARATLDRLLEWLYDTDAKWNGDTHRFTFPSSGATLQLGYIGEAFANQRYQTAEFQFVGWDETAQHTEFDYKFMFSRLRRLSCSIHGLDNEGSPIYDDECDECKIRKIVPIRVRAASNPPRAGDPAMDGWLVKRYQIKRMPSTERKTGYIYRGTHPTRLYVPAFVEDNPYINQKEYRESLAELDPLSRQQLEEGDWGIQSSGRFKSTWKREYDIVGKHVRILNPATGNPLRVYLLSECHKFQTCDPAASTREGPGDTDIWVRKAQSSSVCSTWLLCPDYTLIWLDCCIVNQEIPDVIKMILDQYRYHRPNVVYVEANGLGIGVYQQLNQLGISVSPLSPYGNDKLVRATQAAIRMEQGRILFPRDGIGGGQREWLQEAEAQVFGWTGHPREASDIVDTLAYAGIVAHARAEGNEQSEFFNGDNIPSYVPYR